MTTPHKWAAEIHAMADGKEVEGLIGDWYPATAAINPLTRPDLKWRIVPEKQVLRYRVALLEKGGQKFTQTADGPDDAIELAACPYFVEWCTDWQEVEVD